MEIKRSKLADDVKWLLCFLESKGREKKIENCEIKSDDNICKQWEETFISVVL